MRTARRLAFGLLVALLLLGGVELGLRAALGPPPPAVQVHTAVGEQERYLRVENGMVRATYQFQDPIPPFPAEPSGPRVAFLGGSSVHGGQRHILAGQEFPALVGRMTGVEVLNLATPSLDSHDTLRIVEELLPLRPTAIVVYDGHNDFGNVFFNARYMTASAGLQARVVGLLERFQLYTSLRRQVRKATTGTGLEGRIDQGMAVTAARKEQSRAAFEANLRRIAWLTRKAGVKLAVGTPASCLRMPPADVPCVEEPCAAQFWQQAVQSNDPVTARAALEAARDADPIPLRAPSSAIETVRRVAEDEDLLLVDVVADLPADPLGLPDCRFFADNVHFNEAGHRAMAELFAPAVRTLTGIAP